VTAFRPVISTQSKSIRVRGFLLARPNSICVPTLSISRTVCRHHIPSCIGEAQTSEMCNCGMRMGKSQSLLGLIISICQTPAVSTLLLLLLNSMPNPRNKQTNRQTTLLCVVCFWASEHTAQVAAAAYYLRKGQRNFPCTGNMYNTRRAMLEILMPRERYVLYTIIGHGSGSACLLFEFWK
jgi:hypothetical protein